MVCLCANKLAWKQIHNHAGLGIPNRFNILDCPERVHWEDVAPRKWARPTQRLRPRTLLMDDPSHDQLDGDSGFLRRSATRIRRHNPVGDTLFITGKVVNKRIENDEALVDIEHAAHNQDGELSIEGTGTVRLPRRG